MKSYNKILFNQVTIQNQNQFVKGIFNGTAKKDKRITNRQVTQKQAERMNQKQGENLKFQKFQLKQGTICQLLSGTPKLLIVAIKNIIFEIGQQYFLKQLLGSFEISQTKYRMYKIQLRQILNSMKQLNVEQLWYQSFNKRFHLQVKDIEHIDLIFLKILNLRQSEISSLENISFIRMPCVQKIYLENNNIVSLKPLSKINSKSMQIICLHHNKANEPSQLPFINRMKSTEISQIYINTTENVSLIKFQIQKQQFMMSGLRRYTLGIKKLVKQ